MDAVGQGASPETGRHASVRRKRSRIPAIYFAIALLMLMVVLFTMGNRNFLSPYNLNTIASYSAILLIVGLGQMSTILIGGIDLSVGGLMSFISVLFVISIKAVGFWAFPSVQAAAFSVEPSITGALCTLPEIGMLRGFFASGISRTRSTCSNPFSSEAFFTTTKSASWNARSNARARCRDKVLRIFPCRSHWRLSRP